MFCFSALSRGSRWRTPFAGSLWFLNFSQYELSVVTHRISGTQVVPVLEAAEVTQSNGPVVVWRAVKNCKLEMDQLEWGGRRSEAPRNWKRETLMPFISPFCWSRSILVGVPGSSDWRYGAYRENSLSLVHNSIATRLVKYPVQYSRFTQCCAATNSYKEGERERVDWQSSGEWGWRNKTTHNNKTAQQRNTQRTHDTTMTRQKQ